MTTDVNIKGFVQQDTPRSFSEGVYAGLKANRRGELCVIDFYTQMAMEKRGFEIRGGIDSTTETGATAATTKAEWVADAVSGLTIIPVFYNVALTTAAGTAHEIHLNAIGAVSVSGTARTPLPLWVDSTTSARTTGRMEDEGGCVTVLDAVTSTNRLFTWGGSIALGAYNMSCQWKPLMPAICAGPVCVYGQIGSTTTQPEYHFTFHYIEMETAAID